MHYELRVLKVKVIANSEITLASGECVCIYMKKVSYFTGNYYNQFNPVGLTLGKTEICV